MPARSHAFQLVRPITFFRSGGMTMQSTATARPPSCATEWNDDPRWKGIRRDYTAEDVVRLRGSVHVESHAGPPRRRAALAAAAHRALRPRPGRRDGQPGRADGRGRPEGHLPERLAGGRRRQPRRPDVSRPEPVSRPTACRPWCGGSTTPSAAPTRSSTLEGRSDRDYFAADRGRRRGRLRRPAQRLRADEGA